MRNPRLLVLALATALVLAFGAPALADGHTDDTTVTANLGLIEGTRIISSLLPVVLSDLSGVTMSGLMTAVVAEAAAPGANPWSVTTTLGDLSDGTNTITNDNVAISDRAVTTATGLLTGVEATPDAGEQDMSATRTLFGVTGQSAAVLYTNDYTGTATLTLDPPDGTPSGTYVGTLTVTIVQ